MIGARKRISLNALWILAAAAMLSSAGPALAQTVDPTEASLRILRRSVSAQRDGSHLSLLFALRQLHDADLKPFFFELLASKQWQMQVHAALGLGEISSDKSIDTAWIKSLAPQAQNAVVATALDLNLLPRERMRELLKWEDLQPMARLILVAELMAMSAKDKVSEPVPSSELSPHLTALVQSEDEHVAGLASCLAAQLGDSEALAAFRSKMKDFTQRQSIDMQLWLLDAIRRYRVTTCLDWVKQITSSQSVDADLEYRAVFTLLELQPADGIVAWNKALGNKPSYSQRVRYCTVLLATESKIPATIFDRLGSRPPNPDEELITRMIAVGKAIASQGDVAGTLIQLLDLGHTKSSDWALDYSAKLPPEKAVLVYAHLMDRLRDGKSSGDAISQAVASTSKLFQIDKEQVLDRLQAAEDDSVLQQAILLGLFESDAAEVGTAAASLRRIGSGRADSLALLLIAKHSKSLQKSDIGQLGTIAAGGGGLSEVMQVQAAWMFLKHTGNGTSAMSQVFAKKD